MRLSLWTGLLQSVGYNQNRQQPRVRLFETGLCFTPDEAAENGVRQESVIAGVISGNRSEEHWNLEKQPVDFFDIKGDVESLLSLSGNVGNFEFSRTDLSALHPGQSAQILLNGKVVGHLGAVHPELERKFNLNGRTFVFEILLSEISSSELPLAREISRFPANRRDIAVVISDEIESKSVLQLIEKVGGINLVDLKLFDVYQGKGIEPGYKSLAIAMILQDNDKTLEEKDINLIVSNVVDTLKAELNASLRD